MKTRLARFRSRGFEGTNQLTSNFEKFSALRSPIVMALVLVLLSAAAASAQTATNTFGTAFDEQTTGALDGFTCAMRGTFGWLIIGFGMLLAIWDYFVQKQGHLLIIAVVGVLAVIILSRALPTPAAGC